jgi:hypothetical protein
MEFGFQISDVAFLALAECSLSVEGKEVSAYLHDAFAYLLESRWHDRMEVAYAALFWAFRLDCAGVRISLSTLFDLRSSCPRRAASPSRSRTIPLSRESLPPPLDRRFVEEVELELSCLMMAGALLFLVVPFDLTGPSKLYSKTAGMKLLKLASKLFSSSMLWSFWH